MCQLSEHQLQFMAIPKHADAAEKETAQPLRQPFTDSRAFWPTFSLDIVVPGSLRPMLSLLHHTHNNRPKVRCSCELAVVPLEIMEGKGVEASVAGSIVRASLW